MMKGVSTHSTVDNNDGRQETLTGVGTTHDTNQTLFQVPSEKEREEIIPIRLQEIGSMDVSATVDSVEMFDIEHDLPFEFGTKIGPALFANAPDDLNCTFEIELCLRKDIIWS